MMALSGGQGAARVVMPMVVPVVVPTIPTGSRALPYHPSSLPTADRSKSHQTLLKKVKEWVSSKGIYGLAKNWMKELSVD